MRPAAPRQEGRCRAALFVAIGAIVARLAHQHRKLTRASPRVTHMRQHSVGEQLDRIESVVAIDCKRTKQRLVDLLVQIAAHHRRHKHFRLLNGTFGSIEARRPKWIFAHEHFIGKRGKRPLIGTRVARFKTHLLERHIPNGSTRRSAIPRRMRQLRQTEIGHFDLALPVNQDVIGLDIEVKHLVFMRRFERAGHGLEHTRRHIERQRAFLAHELGERDAIHVFHDQIRLGARCVEVVHAHDVRIGQHGSRACLIEPGNLARRARISGRHVAVKAQAFNSHASLDTRIPRRKHRRETARARFLERPISVQDEILHATWPFCFNGWLLYLF